MKKLSLFFLTILLSTALVLPVHGSAAFTDVPDSFWAVEDIQYAVDRGLFRGVSDTEFAPMAPISRAMLATVLYRYAGSPDITGPSPYDDVSLDRWYTDGIIWAHENRIFPSHIMDASTLGKNEYALRAEFCVMLYQFAAILGKSVPSGGELPPTPFTDMEPALFARAGLESLYYESVTAMLYWAVPNGIMNGVTDTALDPLGPISRAEAAAMLGRFDRNILGGTDPLPEPTPTPDPEPTPTPDEPDTENGPTPTFPLSPAALIMQNPELPNGCEATSLAILLSCTGTPADKMDVLDRYLPKQPFTWSNGVRYGPDPQTAYAGDASKKGGGWYCFENPVITAGDAWLQAHSLPFRVENLTGLSREQLEQRLSQGTPLVVWATLNCQNPVVSTSPWILPDETRYYPYRNLHCFVLTGFSDGVYQSADPIYGWQAVSPDAFWPVFDSMGRRAVTLAPQLS